jgi:hypothetical protein
MRLRNRGKGEALPSLFPRFAPNAHIYLYASIVHMYCIYPAILNRKRLLTMIKAFEKKLCMYLKTLSPDVPRCGRSLHLYALFITDQYQKKYWAGYIGREMLSLQNKS